MSLRAPQVLGEGKPENQNHAMIFCFGECIQTVDMNQENHLAEAFKMRNLLEEFSSKFTAYATGPQSVGAYRDAVKQAAAREPIVALVGFREWIFSGKVREHCTARPPHSRGAAVTAR
jgi:1,3-beta-glucan synthase component